MIEKVAFIFPGQGSQFVGMGKDFYEVFPESKAVFDTADKVLEFPLTRFCFEGPQEELTKTINCQPAILTASIAILEAFKSAIPRRWRGRRYPLSAIRYTAGLSLGEYSALVAAGVSGFEQVLRLVRKRAELMEAAAKKYPGKMAAILGLDRRVIEEVCSAVQAEIANVNCPGQIVITGRIEAVEKAKNMALERGAKRVIDLEVSGAFHSSLMQGAAGEFRTFLEGFSLSAALIPVVSNVTSKAQCKASDIYENLVKQIFSPVLWEDSVRFIVSQGIKTFYEIGPGNVLRGLIRKIDPALEVKCIGSAKDLEIG